MSDLEQKNEVITDVINSALKKIQALIDSGQLVLFKSYEQRLARIEELHLKHGCGIKNLEYARSNIHERLKFIENKFTELEKVSATPSLKEVSDMNAKFWFDQAYKLEQKNNELLHEIASYKTQLLRSNEEYQRVIEMNRELREKNANLTARLHDPY